MKHVPISNNTKHPIYVGKFRVAPGETRIVDEAELPPHMKASEQGATEAEAPADPLLELLDGTVAEVAEALPGLSGAELDMIEQAEADGNTRKGVEKAIAEERLRRAAADAPDAPSHDDDANNSAGD